MRRAGLRLRFDPLRFKRLRLEQSLSQEELARRAGINHSTISYIESGRFSPKLRTIRLLAEALGCGTLDIATMEEAG